ncbi:ATP-binding protein [Caballeronia novacaledonica]|uniref:ATP-binding protein n=1 Tax=Caballeronia novacaledonica TaxID=1544861 RepID=UPI001EE29F56|nr:ATP-binding protein [Caballeronia novacaledonica]GJH07706.1 ATP-binding protein [Caballeronia novacaledonica]
MTTTAGTTTDFDLTPDPRVLQMLGEIHLAQWRCIAELVDNSIDGFLSAQRLDNVIANPEVVITVPRTDTAAARVSVRDNGPGMSSETLEHAVRAGWSGNSPIGSLGLFGMGFNIATARLGLVTEVWTSRAGDPYEIGVRIDLNELRAQRNFRVARQSRPKADHTAHGTEIVISKLKPEQRAWLARGQNTTAMRKHLARAYSALLSPESGDAIFRLELNGTRIQARRHCTWNAERHVETSNGTVHAVERFNVALPARRYCAACMLTLPDEETACPTGSSSCRVVTTERFVRGWVGIQRFMHDTDFGLDIIRNGRKIELGIKDLFEWREGESSEIEYPIDDQRKRGRFVGEIHLDHCRVSYTKDRFERDDPAWDEMVRLVRGDGPLQPIKAKTLGYGINNSPLYRLFQAFRRTSPQGKNGLWSRILVVKDNERALEMAALFENNEPDYLGDERWWQLVEEQDATVLGAPSPVSPDGAPPPAPDDIPPGFFDDDSGGSGAAPAAPPAPGATTSPAPSAPQPVPDRKPIFELTRKYIHPTYRVEYDVQGFAVDRRDPDLGTGHPWALPLVDVATRTYAFLTDTTHDLYRSTTMTPLDALLIELSHRTMDFLRQTAPDVTFASILADFRREYCADSRLDAGEIIVEATNMLAQIAASLQGKLANGEGVALHGALSLAAREAIGRRMVARGVAAPRDAIASGAFLTYADPQTIRDFFAEHPELFLDGKFWDDLYVTLDYGSPEVSEEARRVVRARYDGYFADAVWLASQSPMDLERTGRDAMIRASLSLKLLRPDSED